MVEGIIIGLFAALFQSSGYILSRICIKNGTTPFQLLIRTQIVMGAISCVLLPFVWRGNIGSDGRLWLPLVLSALGSFGGQFFYYRAASNIAPSRLSSLMGLRVVVLAAISTILGMEHYNAGQISGIILAVCSAVLMNYQYGKIQWRGMDNMAYALLSYAVSDLSVRHMITGIPGTSIFEAAMLALILVNLLLFLIALPFSLHTGWRDYLQVTPYSAAWCCKQFFLYSCYGLIGPVFGNVVMSARGPISMVLTLILLHFGVRNLEKPKEASIWIRRGLATLLMAGAITVYSLA